MFYSSVTRTSHHIFGSLQHNFTLAASHPSAPSATLSRPSLPLPSPPTPLPGRGVTAAARWWQGRVLVTRRFLHLHKQALPTPRFFFFLHITKDREASNTYIHTHVHTSKKGQSLVLKIKVTLNTSEKWLPLLCLLGPRAEGLGKLGGNFFISDCRPTCSVPVRSPGKSLSHGARE